MTERNLWDRVRPGLTAAAAETPHPRIDLERIENAASRSMADVHGRWAVFEFWIELKVLKGRRVEFQPGQVDWLERQWAVSANAFVLVGAKRGAWLLYRGDQAGALERAPLDTVAELTGDGSDWAELLERVTFGGAY